MPCGRCKVHRTYEVSIESPIAKLPLHYIQIVQSKSSKFWSTPFLKSGAIPVTDSVAGLDKGPAVPIPECDEILTSLHIYTRTIRNPFSDPLTTKRGLSIVGRYAFANDSDAIPINTQRIASRCLNNIVVLAQPMRQVFVDEGYPQKVVARLKTSQIRSTPYVHIHHLAHGAVEEDAFEVKMLMGYPAQPAVASLKLMSTLAVSYEAQAHRFIPSVQPVFDLLDKVKIPSPPMQLPVSLLVGCLASVPFHDKSRKGAGEMNLLTPMVALQRVSQAVDPESETLKQLKERMLPSEEDRKVVLGKGTTLPHRILHFGVNSTSPELRDPTLTLLFELSNKDSREFVRNVGFGNAVGYLTSKGINLSQEDVAASGIDPNNAAPINPITGQRMDMEPDVDLPEMTEEEKEREAERLFVLFERLRATGVVKVENPAAQAASMAAVEEVDSSDDEKKK
ncbi:unnamed protein product [Parascedosporium putredinis]|uniref:Uncharacterized protein n=1 Tax=Parascedosporium putredinis TaxID=1442378 RepID=A0A9P1M604_9PEZI|nr:unnamed protein product [Parascedosporium putredinis]CAI7988769.1 unnamed protein product [Parascedosporium putredinis]